MVFTDDAVAGRAPRDARRRVGRRVRVAAAASIDVDPSWRSGYYEVVLTVDVDGKTRTSHAFFVVRPAHRRATAPIAAGAGHQHLARLQRLRRAQPLQRRHPRLAPAADDARATCRKPPGEGRRVTVVDAPDPQMAAHVGYLNLNKLSPWAGSAGWPDWEQPFIAWCEREGYALDVVTNADLAGAPRAARPRLGLPALPVGRPRRVLVGRRCATPSRRFIAGAATPPSCPATRRSGRCASRTRRPRARPRRWSGTRASSSRTRCSTPTACAELTSIWSDHLIGRPENHMTGVSFSRGGYHRIGKVVANGRGRLHRPPTRPLAVRGHRPRSTATCSAPTR